MSELATGHEDIDFSDVFIDSFQKLKDDARAVGMSMSDICNEVNCSRATPVRWGAEVPKTIKLFTDMQRAVRKRRDEKGILKEPFENGHRVGS